MGQEIVYCYQCQTRLLGSDFEKGQAFRVGAQVSCPDCVRGLFSSLPPAQIDAEVARLKEVQVVKRSGTTTRLPSVRSGAPDSSAKLKALPPAPPPASPPALRSKVPLILGGAAIVAGILLLFLLSLSSGRAPTPAAEPPPPPSAAPRPPASSPPGEASLPAGAFLELDRAIAARVDSDDFSAAARDLEKARLRRSEAAWSAGIDERRVKVEAKAREALGRFLGPAQAAQHEGRADEVERLRGFIAAFPELAGEFDRRLAVRPEPGPASAPADPPSKPAPAPKPAPPRTSTEASTYRAAWDQAMAARDPALILSALEEAQKGLQAAETKAEATRDLALIRSSIPVRSDGLAALAKLPKDQRTKLEFRDDAVVVGALEGAVQSADGLRLRLATETGVVDLPVSELSEETIGRLYADRAGHGPSDGQAAAVWCAIRGSADGALRLDPTLPAKYLDFAKQAAPAEADGEDRRNFWSAFSEFGMNRSRGSGLDRLLKIQSPRFKPFIDGLLDGAKDAFFTGPDFAATGAFAPSERDKVGSVWLSTADLKTGAATLEAEYYALPDQSYRAWVLAGGCCLEVFTFSLQATGLKGVDPKSKAETSYEPGDAAGQPVKLPSLPLKKIHSQHLGPKEPDRWEWISLPLPKTDAPGLKRIRILTDQKGFAVAHLVVSATRKNPPSSSEMKDLVRDRATAPRFIVSPGPVSGKPTRTAYCGGGGGLDFEDQGPAGAVLVGLKYGVQGYKGNMSFLQPIYRLGGKTSPGGGHGGGGTSMPELVARPGYAVGQIQVSSSDRLDGFKIVFMRHAGGKLLAGDAYESPWVGIPPKGNTKLLGDGSPVGGIFGHKGSEIDGFGLILLK